ncbi:copper resistance protein CopC [Corynebacterium kroppenstedtii]
MTNTLMLRRRRSRSFLVTIGLFAMGITGVPPQAQAHDSVVSSVPEDGSTVSTFPDEIRLTMSGKPQDNFTTLAVSNTLSGKIIAKGSPTISGHVISFTIPRDIDATDGNYVVGFQITSSDGHSTRGSTSFTYRAGSQQGQSQAKQPVSQKASETGMPGHPPSSDQARHIQHSTPSSGIGSAVLWGAVALVSVIIGVLVFTLRRLSQSGCQDRQ